MTVNDPPDPAGQSGARDRRPYEKPAISWEEQMGVRPGLMAACQKVDAGQSADCGMVPSS